jgi:hypothetical protein
LKYSLFSIENILSGLSFIIAAVWKRCQVCSIKEMFGFAIVIFPFSRHDGWHTAARTAGHRNAQFSAIN